MTHKLKPDQSIEIEINGFIVIIKHNDVGFSIDTWDSIGNLLDEKQVWFEDLTFDSQI